MRSVRTYAQLRQVDARIKPSVVDPDERRRLAGCHARRLAAVLLPFVGDPRRVEAIVDAVLDEACSAEATPPADHDRVDAWLLALARRRLATDAATPSRDLDAATPHRSHGPRLAATSASRPLDVVPFRRGWARRAHEPQRTGHVALWIAGAALALAAIALALAIRPALVEPGSREQLAVAPPPGDVPPAPPVAPATAPTLTDPVPARTLRPRVVVHHAGGIAPGRALLVADYLAQAGFTVADIRAVRVMIATRTVRYFFEEDRAAAAAVADALDRLDEGKPSRPPQRLVDLTHYRPLPPPGTVEVWLPPTPRPAR